MKSKKKVLGAFNGSFLSDHVKAGHNFFYLYKGPIIKKFGKSCSKHYEEIVHGGAHSNDY